MMQVKICGITNLEDALCAAENGASALGFIFYPQSPRCIDPQKAGEIIDRLPSHLVKVGVFVNEKEQTVREIFEGCRLDMLQFHGDESPEYCGKYPSRRVIKALELKADEDLDHVSDFDVAAILVDARHAGLYGGTGKTSNWKLAKMVSKPLILSGGLNEDNVLAGLGKVMPAALDINSGMEKRPGKKDAGKIERMMKVISTATSGAPTPQIFVKREEP
jgi:phosphoribosylanthranilate isomerase